MPDIDDVSLRIEATAQQAIATIKKLRGGLYDVKTSTDAATNSTNASAKAVNSAANSVSKLASAYRKMGLTSLSKEMGSVAQAANRIKGVTKSIKDATKAAEFFDKNGKSGIAEAIRGLGADPVGAERALREETRIAKENAAERKAIANWENSYKRAELSRLKKESAAIERAYTQIVEEEAKKRAIAEGKTPQQQRIGARALEKARADAKRATEKAQAADATKLFREQILAEKNRHNAAMEDARREANEEKKRHNAKMQDLYAERTAQAESNRQAKESSRQTAAAAREQSKQLANAKAALKKFGNAFDAPLRKVKELLESFKRIAMYRAIRAAIKAISSAIKEGLTNLYGYSQQVKTAFAPAVDELRKHVLLLKNAFATALRPIIEALIPVIQKLVDWLVKAADFMAQVFSVLTGKVDSQGRYTKAILSDLQDANKQAKELKNTLLGFDEINRLDGTTGDTGAINYGLMFKQAEVSAEALAAADKLRTVLDKVKEIVGKIDWDAVLKVLVALEALKILNNVVNWLKPIVALLGGKGGILALALAVLAVFGLWGDKIHDFIENTAIPETDKWFNKIKLNNAGKGFDHLIDAANNFVDAAETGFGTVSQVVYDLVHGDFKKAGDDLSKGVDKVGEFNAKAVIHIVAQLLVDLKQKWDEFKLFLLTVAKWVVLLWNDQVRDIENEINALIRFSNIAFGTDFKPVKLRIDTTSLDEKIDELKKTTLPTLKEKVDVKGSYTQTPSSFKVKLDTADANRATDTLAWKVRDILDGVNGIISRIFNTNWSHGIGHAFASGGYPAMGSVFIAGEQGAEWVGDINGRTGVMNTDQMANAVYNAVVAAMASAPQSGGGDIYLDGEVIYRNVVNRNNNQVRSTGRAALLT